MALPIGSGAAQKSVAIPLIQAGPVANVNDANLNVNETYTVNLVRGDRRKGAASAVTKASGGAATFEKPVDYIGVKTLGNSAAYAAYAGRHIHDISVPGCPAGKDAGRVFVGQRQEGFAVNLGPIFDLVNAPLSVITNPANINAAAANSIQDKQRHLDRARGAQGLPDRRQRDRDRRLDHGQPAPGPAALGRAGVRPPDQRRSPAAPGPRFRAWASPW